ncbi:hypothetical protein BRC19_00850 [Candidatus Saccharibacteria bacterium QS_5_54_17]|nr:MAG: hypothetical protein BRC19_00850 [Candidatus Saccharibacteria bacterium QS_5_54_17]
MAQLDPDEKDSTSTEAEREQKEESSGPEKSQQYNAAVSLLKKPMHKWRELTPKAKLLSAVGVIVLLSLLVFVIPSARYAALNLTMGTQTVEVFVVDKKTQQPIDKANIQFGDTMGETDEEGRAILEGVDFGPRQITVEKGAYADFSGQYTVDFRVDFFGPVELEPTGVPLKIRAVNKISKTSIDDFQVALKGSELSARSNDNGIAELSAPPPAEREVDVTVTADGYWEKTFTTELRLERESSKPGVVEVVPEGKHYFLSNRTGTIDLVEANLDGSERTVVVEGTGDEKPGTQFKVSPGGDCGAMISTRAGERGPSGDLLPALYIVNFQQRTIERVDEGAPSFQPIGWSGNQFIYQINYRDAGREGNQKLKSVDTASNNALETYVVTKGYFQGVTLLQDKLLYSLTQNEREKIGTFRIDVDNGSEKQVIDTSSHRTKITGAKTAIYQDDNGVEYEYSAESDSVNELQQPSESVAGSDFTVSGKGKVAWIETRDGTRTLIVEGTAVTKEVNVSDILRWHGEDYIIYHSTKDGSTDYIVHVDSQQSLEISDTYERTSRRHHY